MRSTQSDYLETKTEYEDVIDSLEITPHVFGDGYIGLETDIVLGSKNTPEGVKQVLIVTKKEITNKENRIRQGESLIIGGMRKNEEFAVVRGVPILKDIPLIGFLFSSEDTEKRAVETIFILTPTISTGGVPRDEVINEIRKKHEPSSPEDVHKSISDIFGSKEREKEGQLKAEEAEQSRQEAEVEKAEARGAVREADERVKRVEARLNRVETEAEHIKADAQKATAEADAKAKAAEDAKAAADKAAADAAEAQEAADKAKAQANAKAKAAEKAMAEADAKAKAAEQSQANADNEGAGAEEGQGRANKAEGDDKTEADADAKAKAAEEKEGKTETPKPEEGAEKAKAEKGEAGATKA